MRNETVVPVEPARPSWVFVRAIIMARIHQRPRSPYWHASYLGPDGRWILRGTKQEDHQGALAVGMEYERAGKLARRGDLTEAQAREVLKDIMKRADIGETLQGVASSDSPMNTVDAGGSSAT